MDMKEYKTNYYQEHKEEIKAKARKYYKNNKEKIYSYQEDYRKNNKEKIAKYKREYASKNSVKISNYKSAYAKEHRDYLNEYHKLYQRKRRSEDKLHKFKMQIRHLIWLSFNKNGNIKSKKTEDIIGCDIQYFINYLLKTFKDRYDYDYDFKEKVHIDHIIPLKNAISEEDIVKLCHYSNLQLLKASDNLHKGVMNNDDYFEKNFGKEV